MRSLKVLSIVLAMFAGIASFSTARADGCYLCASGSSCDQCRYGAHDTQDARKACEARGCKVQGTTTCSGAANIRYCSVEPKPWTASAPPAAALVCR
jgi:hypothetical protein